MAGHSYRAGRRTGELSKVILHWNLTVILEFLVAYVVQNYHEYLTAIRHVLGLGLYKSRVSAAKQNVS